MVEIEVDPRTGVPLHPEDVLEKGVLIKNTGNIPPKVFKAGIIFTGIIPGTAFLLGYFILPQLTPFYSGVAMAVTTFTFSFITAKTVAWMVG